ncbi:hypothetical protein OKA05_13725 [Luteolibacter arcticus]|uniref:Uncharacterized protein n=1 Tax=Luteolibacter arcticus TaxID=1581411 RepID=A0ABT3GJE5_9BACT|nr:hypothetical protein [Luteolibacter arcticus]MCW1923619.1 hypothetical protein [Luteolibacter arcticus]
MKPWSLVIATALVASLHAQAPATYETGVMLKASDFLPANLLRGPSYRVRDQVPTDGYMAHFTIDSDFGTFTAIGLPEAKRRITEAEAIRKLVETSKGDLFAEGLKRSVEQPIDAVKHIVKNPVEAAKQAPKTVGHFFVKVGSGIGRGVTRAVDRVDDAAKSGHTDAGQAASAAGRGIGNAAKSAAGFDKAKLDTAKQLGVDPYSDNERLQEEMDKVTWAFFAGGLPLRIGAAAASAGLAVAATNMVGIPEDTYALTSGELADRDERSLHAMGVSLEDIKDFQIQRVLSTTRRHRIVTYLEAMPKASGRGDVVRLANACNTPEQADFLISGLAILAERDRTGAAAYVSLKVLGRLPGATTATGELHVPAPVDHVTWTDEVAGFAQRDDLGTAPKVLLHTGRMSAAATAGILAAGWTTVGVAYPSR